MAELVSDELWEQVEPLLPREPEPAPLGGRPRVTNRQAFTGVVFVLKTGIPWQSLPIAMDCCSGSRCRHRCSDWTALAVWSKLHRQLLSQLGKAGAINLEGRNRQRQCPRSFWGAHTGPTPTDRAKAGCKLHVLTDAAGIPLVVKTTPANTRDDQVALPLVESCLHRITRRIWWSSPALRLDAKFDAIVFGIYFLLILIYNVMHRRTSHERGAMKTIKDLSEMTGRSCWTIYQYQRFGAFGEIESDRIGGTIVFGDKDVPKLVKILKDAPNKGRKKKK